MFILRPVREKFSDLNRSAVRKRLPTPGLACIIARVGQNQLEAQSATCATAEVTLRFHIFLKSLVLYCAALIIRKF